MLTNLFLSLGFTRDSKHWLWIEIVSVAGLLTSGAINLPYWAAQLGIPLSAVGEHWIQALAVIALWVAGKYDSSSLPGAKKP